MSDVREFEAPAAAAGLRLDKMLAGQMPGLSRSSLARLIAAGQVSVNGAPCAVSTKVRSGDRIRVVVPPPEPADLTPEPMPLAILHEDADLIVLDKPAGLVVHPGANARTGTLAHALLAHCGAGLTGVGGRVRPGIVHRLDKGTTGVLVVAKTQAAHESLSAQFAARSVEKLYLAVVRGLAAASGRIDAPIGRSPVSRTRMAVATPRARPALTEWVRREVFGRSASLLEVRLHTGRTHQVRVHLAHAGLPLVGDATYGAPRLVAPDARMRPVLAAFGRPALHAWRLAFEHPGTGQRMEFEAPIPADLAGLLDELRRLAPAR